MSGDAAKDEEELTTADDATEDEGVANGIELDSASDDLSDDASEDDYELWQLESWLKEAREEDAAQDYFASFYSY